MSADTKGDIVDEIDRLAYDILREDGALSSGSPSGFGYADLLFKRALAKAWPEIRARLKSEEATRAEIEALRRVADAAHELEQFLTHNVGMDKPELTLLRFLLAAVPPR